MTVVLPDRLLKRRQITQSGCWEWKPPRSDKGYGVVMWQGRKGVGVHRIVAHLVHGLDLNDRYQLACHRCDNPPCFNPDHIYVGTHWDNFHDAIDRGRLGKHPRVKICERCGSSYEPHPKHRGERKLCLPCAAPVLSDDDVRDIRRALSVGKRGIGKLLAEQYGISEQHLSGIKHGRSYQHVSIGDS